MKQEGDKSAKKEGRFRFFLNNFQKKRGANSFK